MAFIIKNGNRRYLIIFVCKRYLKDFEHGTGISMTNEEIWSKGEDWIKEKVVVIVNNAISGFRLIRRYGKILPRLLDRIKKVLGETFYKSHRFSRYLVFLLIDFNIFKNSSKIFSWNGCSLRKSIEGRRNPWISRSKGFHWCIEWDSQTPSFL